MRETSIALFIAGALSVAFPGSVFSQELTCPAGPEQLAVNIAKQERQNAIADSMGWSVIRDTHDLRHRAHGGGLVAVPRYGRGYRIDLGSYSEPYLVPQAHELLVELSRTFNESTGGLISISALTRPDDRHRVLRRRNPNAASCVTELRCSSHRRGTSFDIRYRMLAKKKFVWLRKYLHALEAEGRTIVTQEVCRPNFHGFVVPPPKEVRMTDAAVPPVRAADEAARVEER